MRGRYFVSFCRQRLLPHAFTYLSQEVYELQDDPVLKQSSGRFTSGIEPARVLHPLRLIVGQPAVKSGAIFSVLTPCGRNGKDYNMLYQYESCATCVPLPCRDMVCH
jgi:hypothetical protein